MSEPHWLSHAHESQPHPHHHTPSIMITIMTIPQNLKYHMIEWTDDQVDFNEMKGRRKARGYARPPLPNAQLTPTQPGIAVDSSAYHPAQHGTGISEDSAGYFPLPSPGNFPLPRGIWEESPLYRVPREIWDESPGYMPGPSPGYHPIPPVNPDESPGYSPGPSPGYAPVRSSIVNTPFNRQADVHRSPRTPQVGFSEIVGPIIVPEAREVVRTVRNE
ncbi:hypothetical protein R1sor_019654 [Riccia sorocarpa]|uniref:Uncharacterized protein n=1 Tax=Riccia sorocarpa TaxID=122646 RepID=A0ABD3IFU5_9MARC